MAHTRVGCMPHTRVGALGVEAHSPNLAVVGGRDTGGGAKAAKPPMRVTGEGVACFLRLVRNGDGDGLACFQAPESSKLAPL